MCAQTLVCVWMGRARFSGPGGEEDRQARDSGDQCPCGQMQVLSADQGQRMCAPAGAR